MQKLENIPKVQKRCLLFVLEVVGCELSVVGLKHKTRSHDDLRENIMTLGQAAYPVLLNVAHSALLVKLKGLDISRSKAVSV